MLRPRTQRHTRFSNADEFHASAHSNRQFALVFLVYFSLFCRYCADEMGAVREWASVYPRALHMEMVFYSVFVFYSSSHLASTEHKSFSTELCLNIFSNSLMSWQIETRTLKTHIGNATEHWMKIASFRPKTFRSDIWFMVASNFR